MLSIELYQVLKKMCSGTPPRAAAVGTRICPRVLAAFEDVRVALLRASEEAWDDYFDRENPRPLDESIGNEASLARMTALGCIETVCASTRARRGGQPGLPPPKDD